MTNAANPLLADARVSFVLPHKGRSEMLLETIASIQAQQTQAYPAALTFEILVVSQSPDVKEALEPLAENIRLFLRPAAETISALRNYGVSQAQGNFIAYLDADVALSSNWLCAMLAELQQGSCVIASAVQTCADDAPVLEKIRTWLSNAETDCDVEFLPGRNLLMRKQDVALLGGFPEHLVTCEDYYFTQRAAQLGSLRYSSKATYVHIGEDKALLPMFKKEIWRGQSNLQSIKGRHIPLREWPSFFVPVVMMALFLMALVNLSLGNFTIALTALLFAITPLAAYSLRLYKITQYSIPLKEILYFYGLYFPARAIGTLSGLVKTLSISMK